MPEGVFNSRGYPQAVVTNAVDCTGCGICGWMCPDQAIEVFRYVESGTKAGK
jgi:NAD-dependent dihydropyrimidine dehydrogenase PreA subunit